MRPLSEQDAEAELSYAYLHAVAAHANMCCQISNRHQDNAGIDATITSWGPFSHSAYHREVDFKIQLKATIKTLTTVRGKLAYFVDGAKQYADLTAERFVVPRFLVVLCLPQQKTEWLRIDGESLALKKCAYWVSLRGAPASPNDTGQTIRIPCNQLLDAAAMSALADAIACREIPIYDPD